MSKYKPIRMDDEYEETVKLAKALGEGVVRFLKRPENDDLLKQTMQVVNRVRTDLAIEVWNRMDAANWIRHEDKPHIKFHWLIFEAVMILRDFTPEQFSAWIDEQEYP